MSAPLSEPLSEPFAGLGPAGEALLSIGGQDMPVSYAEVREAMDAWAHELAEKIREDFRREFSRVTANMGVSPAQQWLHGADTAADLIDPEVT